MRHNLQPQKKENSVLIDNENLKKGNIPARSGIKVDKLFTIKKSIVIRKIAKVDEKKINEVRIALFKLI